MINQPNNILAQKQRNGHHKPHTHLPLRVVGKTQADFESNFERLKAWIEDRKIACTNIAEAPPKRREEGFTHGFKMQCLHTEHGEDKVDRNPSLEIYLHQTGLLDFFCPVCGVEKFKEISAALTALFQDCQFVEPITTPQTTTSTKTKKQPPTTGCTLEELFVFSPKCAEIARKLGWNNETSPDGERYVKIPYRHIEEPEVFFFQKRLVVEPKNGEAKYKWSPNAPASELLHGLDLALEMLKTQKVLFLCESPTDSVALIAMGFPAVNCAGKGNVKAFVGLKGKIPDEVKVIAWQEPDADDFAVMCASYLQRSVVCFDVEEAMEDNRLPAKDALRVLKEFEGDTDTARIAIEAAIKKHSTVVEPNLLTNLEAVLDLLETYFRTFVKVSEHFYTILPLWVAHTYAIDLFHFTPYLLITSPVKQCGKTLLRNLISAVAYNALPADNASLAALFREIEKHRGRITVLLDEVDRWLAPEDSETREDFIGLLNTGFQRGSKYLRCERNKGGFETKEYQVFCPKVIVGLSNLTDTVRDRSIIVEMQRYNHNGDNLKRFPYPEDAARILDKETHLMIQRIRNSLNYIFSDQNTLENLKSIFNRIYNYRPPNGSSVPSRARDISECLLAIAALAGRKWLQKALQAMQQAFGKSTKRLSDRETMLHAVYQIAKDAGSEHITTEEILEKISEFEEVRLPPDFHRWERDWQSGGEYGLREGGKWLNRMLKGFEINKVRVDNKRAFSFAEIEAVWKRYVEPYLSEESQFFEGLLEYLFGEEEPHQSEPPQPVETLSEPICPHCNERLEPDGGLASCVGCGRQYVVEISEPQSPTPAPPQTEPEPPPQTTPEPPQSYREKGSAQDTNAEFEETTKVLAVEEMRKEGESNLPPPAGVLQDTGNEFEEEMRKESGGENGDFPPPASGAPQQPHLFAEHTTPQPTAEPTAQPQRFTRLKENGEIEITGGNIVVTCNSEKLRSAAKPEEEIPDLELPPSKKPFTQIFPVVVDIEAKPLDSASNLQDLKQLEILAIGLLTGSESNITILRADKSEKEVLQQFIRHLQKVPKLAEAGGKNHCVLVGHNLLAFDIPLLIERCKVHGLIPPFKFVFNHEGEPVVIHVFNTAGVVSNSPLSYHCVRTNRNVLPADFDFADTLHLVARYDTVAKEMSKHNLKDAAQHFGLAVENRVELSPQEIVDCFYNNPERFEDYLKADLIEAYRLFNHLAPPYFYISEFVNRVLENEGALSFSRWKIEHAIVRSTAKIVETLLEAHYKDKPLPKPEEKKQYEGGLVLCRAGVYRQAAKVDIASLYPSIMLAYRVHSRKDTEGWLLSVLKYLKKKRLDLKKLAKEGKKEADHAQQALKILINSVYGFYGTGGYAYNDMQAAETVTRLGREILTLIIYTIEECGGVVAEADTDGVIFSHHNPQKVVEAINAALPQGFQIELEWQDCVAFISDKKNYIIFNLDSTVKEVKGAKWRGRDKPKFQTTFVLNYLREYLFNSPQAAQQFAQQVAEQIAAGGAEGLEWIKVTRKVGKGNADKFLKQKGAQEGETVTYVYADKKRKEPLIIKQDTNLAEVKYDITTYLKEFQSMLSEINSVLSQQFSAGCGVAVEGGGASG